MDVDPEAVRRAQEKGLVARQGELGKLSYPDASFDVVTMRHVIEHVSDPLELLQECHRILRDGGWLVLATPNIESLGHRYFRSCWFPLEPPRHQFIFSRKTLGIMVSQAGFLIKNSFTIPRSAAEYYLASRSIRSQGSYNTMEYEPRAYEKLLSKGFAWMEWLLQKFNPDLGEEIILIARK